jgi:hypothetical protein
LDQTLTKQVDIVIDVTASSGNTEVAAIADAVSPAACFINQVDGENEWLTSDIALMTNRGIRRTPWSDISACTASPDNLFLYRTELY